MRKLSVWAKHNVVAARVAITFIHSALLFLAFYLGTLLEKLPGELFFIALALVACVWLVYPHPSKRKQWGKKFYPFQKSCDFIAATSCFILICFIANHDFKLPAFKDNLYAVALTSKLKNPNAKAQDILASLGHRDKSSLTNRERRILKREFRKQLGVYVKANLKGNKSEGGDAVKIMLVIIGSLGLLALLSLLACELACDGATAAAVFIGILGTAGVIWAAVALIKRINQQSKKEKKNNKPGISFDIPSEPATGCLP